MNTKFWIVGFASVAALSCGKKKSSNNSDAPAAPAGSLEIVSTGETALKTVFEVDGAKGSLEAGASGTLVLPPSLTTTTYCDSGGNPIHSDSAKNDTYTGSDGTAHPYMKRSLPEYPGSKFFCMLNYNNYKLTTVQGAAALPKMFICAGGTDLKPNEAPIKVTLTSSSACVVDPEFKEMIDLPENQGGMGGSTVFNLKMVSPSARAADGWDFDLYAGDLGDGSQAKLDAAFVRMSFKTKGNEAGFAFQMSEPNGSGVGGDSYQLMYKLGSDGELRFETRRQFIECTNATTCSAGKRRYTRHARLLAKGSIDSTGKFSSLSGISGIDSMLDWSDGSSDSATPVTGVPSNIQLYTINGSATSGFRTVGYTSTATLSSPLTVSMLTATDATGTMCYGGDKSCSGVTALKPTADADMAFFMDARDTATQKSLDWYKATKPLTFTTVTFAGRQD